MISRVAGSPGSHVVSRDRLNFLKVGKLSSSLRSLPSLCLERHSGPATKKKIMMNGSSMDNCVLCEQIQKEGVIIVM